jgi:hypothetical protein
MVERTRSGIDSAVKIFRTSADRFIGDECGRADPVPRVRPSVVPDDSNIKDGSRSRYSLRSAGNVPRASCVAHQGLSAADCSNVVEKGRRYDEALSARVRCPRTTADDGFWSGRRTRYGKSRWRTSARKVDRRTAVIPRLLRRSAPAAHARCPSFGGSKEIVQSRCAGVSLGCSSRRRSRSGDAPSGRRWRRGPPDPRSNGRAEHFAKLHRGLRGDV